MSVEGFSSKLNADYTELANTYLDHIPVYTETDFKTTEVCLKYLLEKNEVGTGSDELRERVIDIKALLDHPEIYVELEINYNLFKDIIIDRIKSKIKEFETMSPQEKKDYIENQQKQREEVQRTQAQLATAQPPTGEARTLTEAAYLAELQQQFQREGISPALLDLGIAVRILMIGGVTLNQILALDPDLRTQILQSYADVNILMSGGVTFDQILALDPDLRTQILQSPNDVRILMNRGVTFNQILALDPDLRIQILQSYADVNILMSRNVTFDQILALDPDLRTQILQSSTAVALRLDKGETWNDIVAHF